jgi:hypothetical protein
MPQHLVLPDQHLRLGLVVGALVAAAEGEAFTTCAGVGSYRGRAQSGRGMTARSAGAMARHFKRRAREAR